MDVGWENPAIFSMVSQDLESTPTETIILKLMFQVPGAYVFLFLWLAMSGNCCLFFELEFPCFLEEILPATGNCCSPLELEFPCFLEEILPQPKSCWWKVYQNFSESITKYQLLHIHNYLLRHFPGFPLHCLCFRRISFYSGHQKTTVAANLCSAWPGSKKGTFGENRCIFNSQKTSPNGGAKPRRFQSSDSVKKPFLGEDVPSGKCRCCCCCCCCWDFREGWILDFVGWQGFFAR